MEFIVLTVTKKSKHAAANYVEDEQMLIVQDKHDSDVWWEASDFFYMADIKEFYCD